MLARTRAEARALSYLMRDRVLGNRTDIKRAVIEVSRDVDGRMTEPLEIAVGDRLRIGATQWEKQLFNGTVVTVEDLEITRKKTSRTESETSAEDTKRQEPSVLITGRTGDGRLVKFSHDEIRDYKDNIRLDYGYALTIASAQGLTRGPGLPAGRCETRAGDYLSRRDTAPRILSTSMSTARATGIRHHREAAGGSGGAAGDGHRHKGASGGALVALAA